MSPISDDRQHDIFSCGKAICQRNDAMGFQRNDKDAMNADSSEPKEEKVEVNKGEKCDKKKHGFNAFRYIFKVLQGLSYLSVFIAGISLITTLWPQTKFWSDNIIEKANAGDIESQLFLADHYYEVSDIKESIYWYKIASANEGKYKAIALNNLAYIYITSEYAELNNYEAKSYYLFKKAANMGEKRALINGYIVLKRLPSYTTIIEDYKDELDWIKNELIKSNLFTSELASYEMSFTFIRKDQGEQIPANTKDYVYEYVSGPVALQSSDRIGYYYSYIWNVYKRELNVPDIDDFWYIPIDY